jgi:hypothetical protein
MRAVTRLSLAMAVLATACARRTPHEPRDAASPIGQRDAAADASPPEAEPDASRDASTDAGFQACVSEQRRAELAPLDLYVLLDRSASMRIPEQIDRWGLAVAGIQDFLSLEVGKLSVGLGLFPVLAAEPFTGFMCSSDEECGAYGPCTYLPIYFTDGCAGVNLRDSCVPEDYRKPLIELAPLAAARERAMVALTEAQPDGQSTPTTPALEGALLYLREQLAAHPERQAVLVLATDGEPALCTTNDLEAASEVIERARADGILTFVVGVSEDANLAPLAVAGGTEMPILLSADIQADLSAALTEVRNVVADCTIELPVLGGLEEIDPALVNLELTAPGQGAVVIPRVADGVCGEAEAWRYDDAAHPTRVELCPRACARARAQEGIELDLALGCRTVLL